MSGSMLGSPIFGSSTIMELLALIQGDSIIAHISGVSSIGWSCCNGLPSPMVRSNHGHTGRPASTSLYANPLLFRSKGGRVQPFLLRGGLFWPEFEMSMNAFRHVAGIAKA